MSSFDLSTILSNIDKGSKKMSKNYDTVLNRLVMIITKLSNNERYTTKEFATEFGVSDRTIQNDIYKRLYQAYPIEKDSNGKFKFVDGFSLDKSMLNNREMILLSLSLNSYTLNNSFKNTSKSILQKLLFPTFFNPYYMKQNNIESIDFNNPIIKDIEYSIKYKYMATILYKNDNIIIEPYKITSFDGFWYLFAKDCKTNTTKTFILSDITKITIDKSKHFKINDNQIEELLSHIDSPWYIENKSFQVVIEVLPPIAQYFKKKSFLYSQKIIKEFDNGTLHIEFYITHDEDIDNLIKSWLPHIKVISPLRFKNKIHNELKQYLEAS